MSSELSDSGEMVQRGAANGQFREGSRGCTLYQEVQDQSCIRSEAVRKEEIKVSKEAKYLGVVLDSKLNWSRPLEHAFGKVTQAYWTCRRAFGSTWGLAR